MVNLDVTSYARCVCFAIVCLRFQVVQMKQVDCKMSNKNVSNNYKHNIRDIFGQLHTQEYKATKKQIVRFSLEIGGKGGGVSLKLVEIAGGRIFDVDGQGGERS